MTKTKTLEFFVALLAARLGLPYNQSYKDGPSIHIDSYSPDGRGGGYKIVLTGLTRENRYCLDCDCGRFITYRCAEQGHRVEVKEEPSSGEWEPFGSKRYTKAELISHIRFALTVLDAVQNTNCGALSGLVNLRGDIEALKAVPEALKS